MRGPIGRPTLSRRSKILIGIGVALLAILLIGPRVVSIITDWMWFDSVGYSGVMSTVVTTRIVAFVSAGIVVGAIVFGGIYAAYRTRPDFVPVSGPGDPLERYRVVIGRRPWLAAVIPSILIGIVGGLIAQASWATIQVFLNGESFGDTDPQFGLDYSFYAFTLPFVRMLLDLAFIAVGVAFVGNLVTQYVFGGIRLGGGGRRGMLSGPARVQLAVIVGVFILLKAVGYWLDRYDLLSSERRGDIFTGATYTDINVVLPSKLILMAIAIVCAVAFFAAVVLRDLRVPAMATVLMLLAALTIGVIWPAAMEQFSVKPSADSKEAEYISRNIAATSDAYRIRRGTDVTYENDWTATPAKAAAVNSDAATLSNIRLLDPSVISPTFIQRQAGKNFYGFPSQLAVDRYMVDGQQRDFIVAARELDPNRYNDSQKSWINKHTKYTHGNGIVAAQANTVDAPSVDATSDQGGLPAFIDASVQTIASGANAESPIRVKEPRIYFGELIANVDPDYAIVGSDDGTPREYDTDASNYTYTADSGVSLGNLGSRILYAVKYGERNILLSDAINSESKILYNRDPRDRVKKVAPWLTVDSKTYPAVMADGSIKWIVDGYTTLKTFPYSQKMVLSDATADSRANNAGDTGRTQPDEEVAYVRNSVKATVDAYTGDVTLYQADDTDPVLKTWMKVFPDTVKPKSELDKRPDLKAHLRYPEDLFKLQRELLTKYHVSDPTVFYQASAFWSVPNDPTPSERKAPQPPYYFTANAPDGSGAQFQLTAVTTPLNRSNLASYFTVSSDPEDYGKITVKVLPSSANSQGPQQMQDTMKSAVSGDVTLQRESTVNAIYGNLLTLPVGGNGILYVQPIYTQSKTGDAATPKLYRMLAYYRPNTKTSEPADASAVNIGFAPTIGAALAQVGINPAAATAPEEGDTAPTPKPTEPAPPTDNGAGGDAARDAAVRQLGEALDAVQAAQSSGDLGKLGDALTKLDAAVKKYEALGGG